MGNGVFPPRHFSPLRRAPRVNAPNFMSPISAFSHTEQCPHERSVHFGLQLCLLPEDGTAGCQGAHNR